MGHTSPNPPQSLDKILNVTTEQVWEAIRQLLELRPFVFNNDEGARISLAADKRDVARFEEHAVVQFQRPIQEVVQEMRDIFSYIVRPNHSRFIMVCCCDYRDETYCLAVNPDWNAHFNWWNICVRRLIGQSVSAGNCKGSEACGEYALSRSCIPF
ncbi:hypothetical protein ACSS6W_000028 [Trichoderma asperelloides]